MDNEVVARLAAAAPHPDSLDQAMSRAQAIVRRHVPVGRSLAEELLAERRREAELS